MSIALSAPLQGWQRRGVVECKVPSGCWGCAGLAFRCHRYPFLRRGPRREQVLCWFRFLHPAALTRAPWSLVTCPVRAAWPYRVSRGSRLALPRARVDKIPSGRRFKIAVPLHHALEKLRASASSSGNSLEISRPPPPPTPSSCPPPPTRRGFSPEF